MFKRIVQWALIVIIAAGLLILANQAYPRTAAWKVLYRAVQAANLQASAPPGALSVPFACLQDTPPPPPMQDQLREALAVYDQHNLQTPILLRLAGQAECWLGEPARARAHFEAARQIDPGDALSALELTALYQHSGNQAALDDLMAQQVVPPLGLVAAANQMIRRGQPQTALTWVRLAVQAGPNEPAVWRAWRAIGIAYQADQDWSSAAAVYQAALDETSQPNPYRAMFLLRLGFSLNNLTDPQQQDQAEQYYTQAIADGRFLDATDPSAAYIYRGNWRRARRAQYSVDLYLSDYLQALALYPESPTANLMTGLVNLDEFQDPVAALGYIEKAAALAPDSAWIQFNLGQVRFANSDWKGAVQAYQAALDLDPEIASAASRLHEALQKAGESTP